MPGICMRCSWSRRQDDDAGVESFVELCCRKEAARHLAVPTPVHTQPAWPRPTCRRSGRSTCTTLCCTQRWMRWRSRNGAPPPCTWAWWTASTTCRRGGRARLGAVVGIGLNAHVAAGQHAQHWRAELLWPFCLQSWGYLRCGCAALTRLLLPSASAHSSTGPGPLSTSLLLTAAVKAPPLPPSRPAGLCLHHRRAHQVLAAARRPQRRPGQILLPRRV